MADDADTAEIKRFVLLASAAEATGASDSAIFYYSQVISSPLADTQLRDLALFRRGMVALSRSDTALAEKDFAQVWSSSANEKRRKRAGYICGEIALSRHKYREARDLFRAVVQGDSIASADRLMRVSMLKWAKCSDHTGEKSVCRQLLSQIIKLWPDTPEAEEARRALSGSR